MFGASRKESSIFQNIIISTIMTKMKAEAVNESKFSFTVKEIKWYKAQVSKSIVKQKFAKFDWKI